MAEIFTQRIIVDPSDIDELNHVNNVVYLRWAQEIAIAHWSTRGSSEMVQRFVWVVARHEIDYRAPLTLGDEVEARTWVAPTPQGALWARHVEIGKVGEAKPSAAILSSWCLLDATTRRVKRVPPEIVERFV